MFNAEVSETLRLPSVAVFLVSFSEKGLLLETNAHLQIKSFLFILACVFLYTFRVHVDHGFSRDFHNS